MSEDFKVGDRVVWRSFPNRVGVIESVAAWWVRATPGGHLCQRYPDDLELAPPEPQSLFEAAATYIASRTTPPYDTQRTTDCWYDLLAAVEREKAKQ